MERIDIYKRGNVYENELKLLAIAPISEKNKELVTKYSDFMFAKGCGKTRVAKLSIQLRKIGLLLQKDFDTVNRDDIIGLLAKINRDSEAIRQLSPQSPYKRKITSKKPYSYDTKKDYWRIIKSFFTWLFNDDKKLFKDLSLAKRTKGKDLGDIITNAEMERVLSACKSIRDRALLSLLHETGARVAEILNIRIKDITRFDRVIKVRLDGKTGERRVIVVSSVPYIYRYLETHPDNKNPNALLWISTQARYRGKPITYIGFCRLIKIAFAKAELQHKKCNPHYFRHSRATINAKHLTETQMCLYFGWIQGSEQVQTYVHASGRDADDAILAMNGIRKKEDYKPSNVPKTCTICKTDNEHISDFCKNCGTALTLRVALDTEQTIKTETNKTVQFLMEIMQNPERLKEFQKFSEAFEKNNEGGEKNDSQNRNI